jgi:hypothetical protein
VAGCTSLQGITAKRKCLRKIGGKSIEFGRIIGIFVKNIHFFKGKSFLSIHIVGIERGYGDLLVSIVELHCMIYLFF